MVLGLVKDMIYTFVKAVKNTLVFTAILSLGFYPLAPIYAQTALLYETNVVTPNTNVITCDEGQPLQFRINSHPDMADVNEVRIPFSKFNAGANNGSWTDFTFIIDGVTQEIQAGGIPITWLYHNNNTGTLVDPNSENWTRITLNSSYDVASTSEIRIEMTCTGFGSLKDLTIDRDYNNIDYILRDGASYENARPIIAFSYFEPVVPNAPLNIDILGSTSPSDVFNAVTDGVQTTSEEFAPLYAILGVPLSFIIGRSLVLFIRTAI